MATQYPSVAALTAFAQALNEAGTLVGRDLTIRQLHTLAVVVAAGDGGIDVNKLSQVTASSSAAVSRNVRVMGSHHYDRTKGDGMGLLTVELDPMDNRRRIAKPTQKGRDVVAKIMSYLK